jgi:very-short-patch-repair endonuclease
MAGLRPDTPDREAVKAPIPAVAQGLCTMDASSTARAAASGAHRSRLGRLAGGARGDACGMCARHPPIKTYAALRAAGRSRRWIDAAVSVGALRRVRRGVYAESSACEPAVTAAAHGGSLACVSAARHLGLWVLDESAGVHVWLHGDGHRRHADGCTCIEHWDEASVANAFEPPPVARILRQILACRGLEAFFVSLESAFRLKRLTNADLEWLRRTTNAEARAAISYARRDADSGLESLLRWRLRHLGLAIRSQVKILDVGIVDFLIGDRLIVEVDGKPNHATESMRHKDLVRDANAAAADYVTLRFDYAMVIHDWPLVERAIRAQVSAGRHHR